MTALKLQSYSIQSRFVVSLQIKLSEGLFGLGRVAMLVSFSRSGGTEPAFSTQTSARKMMVLSHVAFGLLSRWGTTHRLLSLFAICALLLEKQPGTEQSKKKQIELSLDQLESKKVTKNC